MLRSRIARTFALLSWLAVGASCGGNGFEPSSKVQSLRVLALQKDPPYARPGETVSLKVLYWDGRTADSGIAKPEFELFWCDNPPGDLYYNCFPQLVDPRRHLPTFAPEAGLDGASEPDAGETDATDAGTPDEAGVADAADLPDAGAATDASDPDAGAPVDDAGLVADASEPPDASLDGTASDGAMTSGDAAPPAMQASIFESSIYIPDKNIIRERPRGVTPYGLVYVLFSACAGKLGLASTAGPQNGLPINCFDDGQQPVGPENFVPGYSSIYVYDSLRNANPIVNDLAFRGMSIGSSFEAAEGDVQHVQKCEGDRDSCPEYDVDVVVDPTSAEVDLEAKDQNGNRLQEQLWVAYHSTDGDFKSALRLVNDATHGWNADHVAKFRAPAKPGPVRLFGIVHDNRGGVGWALGKIVVD